jgi:hypothetical protein
VTLALVALALALGVWLWRDRAGVTDDERTSRKNSVFVAWRRDELTRITIAHEGETVVLEREVDGDGRLAHGKEGAWRMRSPRQERADPVAVERLVATLEVATVARRASESASLELDPPRASGSVRMGDVEVPFVLGGTSPRPEGSGYFRVGREAPVVVTREVVEALLASSDVYRDRAVVPYLATELARVEVRRPDGGFTLERLDDRSFRTVESGVLTSRVALERLWAALAEMRAEAFPKDADVERLIARPAVTLALTPKDANKPRAELVIGEACPGHPADVVVVVRAPARSAACAPKDVLAAFALEASQLDERRVFGVRMDEIEELRLERSAGVAAEGAPRAIELARKGTGFHERAPEDRDLNSAEAEAGTELLTRLASSEATSVARAPAGAPPFVAVARARVRAGEHEESVDVGAPRADGGATLRRVLDDARLEVDAAVVRRLVPRATSLRPRDVLTGEPRRAVGVTLGCGVAQELRDRGEGMRLVSPAGYETDGAIVQLLDGLLRGHIDAWVADADDGRFGFGPSACRVAVSFDDDRGPEVVWFGAEGEGGVYARVESRAGVMVAPKALRELAGRLYVSRALLGSASSSSSSSVEAVRVTVGGRPVAGVPAGAVAGLSAARVVSLTREVGSVEVVIEASLAEGGPPRRVLCGAVQGGERRCAVDGVLATFVVSESRLAPLLGSSSGADAGPPPDASPVRAARP